MLTATTTSTSDRLTTVANLKQLLDISWSSQDDLLDSTVLDASDAVATFVGYWPLRQRYSETVAGFGGLRLMLSATPIRQIREIRIDSQLVDPTTYYVDKPMAGIVHRDKGWPWTAGVEWDLEAHVVPQSELKRFTVDYEAGWVLTTSTADLDASGFITSSGGRTLPNDFERGVLEQAKSLFLGRKRDSTIVEKRIGATNVVYQLRGQLPSTLALEAERLLERYRRIK